MAIKRAHVVISGRVQGVYFRQHTRREALLLGLVGWVRNLFDGRVEAVFEGEAELVDAVIKWCHAGPPAGSVDKVKVTWEEPMGDYSSFSVRPSAPRE